MHFFLQFASVCLCVSRREHDNRFLGKFSVSAAYHFLIYM